MSLVAFSINLSGEADCEVRLSFSTSHLTKHGVSRCSIGI